MIFSERQNAFSAFSKLLASDKKTKFVISEDSISFYSSGADYLKTITITDTDITVSGDSKHKPAILIVYNILADLSYTDIANTYLNF